MKHFSKYIFVVVLIILCMMILFASPQLSENQQQTKYQNTITQLEQLRDQFASTPEILINIGQWSRFSTSWYMEPADNSEGGIESLQLESGLDLNDLSNDLPDINLIEWENEELVVLLHRIYIKQTESTSNLPTGYDTSSPPDFFAIQAFFNSYDRSNSCTYIVDVDEQGFYRFIGCDDTYDLTNGIVSNGRIQLDSADLWPKQKAILLQEDEI